MFTEEFEKKAGEASEIAGTILGFPGGSLAGAGLGFMKGKYSKKEQEQADKKSFSNWIFPPLGAYRFARRRSKDDDKE